MEFADLERIRRDLHSLKPLQVNSLKAYFNPKTFGFSHLRISTTGASSKFSRASSATCVVSLIATGSWETFEKELESSSNSASDAKYPPTHLKGFVDALLKEKPSEVDSAELGPGNPFAVAFSLEALKVASCALEKAGVDLNGTKRRISGWIAGASELLLDNLAATRSKSLDGPDKRAELGSAHIENLRPTTFLTQLVVRALHHPPPLCCEAKRTIVARINRASANVADWSWGQMLHELALLTAGKRGSDPLALAYAIVLFVTCKGVANLTLDQSRIVGKGIETFFGAQFDDGGWQQSRPLHYYPKVGSAYCFDYELLVQLLQCAGLTEHLLPHLPNLKREVKRIQDTALPILNSDGKCWSSGHHPHLPDAESWSTASVYHFIHGFDRLLAEAIRRHVFEYVGARYTPLKRAPLQPRAGKKLFRREFVDSSIELDSRSLSLTTALTEKFLVPVANQAPQVAIGSAMSKKTPIAGILFGPPGTSKTQLAQIIAEYLGWPLLSIDPSHLVKGGLDKVQAESNLLFGMLATLEQTVVFLDEFDELMRERTSESADITSRFLTTAMLPKLTNISNSRRVVFLLATNHISQFDFAIRRPGRFDMVVQIMPPTWKAKKSHKPWKTACGRISKAIKTVSPPVTKNSAHQLSWAEMLGDLTFDEFKALAGQIQQIASAPPVDSIRQMVARAWERCTLAQRMDVAKGESSNAGSQTAESHDTNGLTWRQQCLNDRKLIRFL